MKKEDFYRKFEDILEMDPGTIAGDEALDGLEGWDSLAIMAFIAMVDEELGTTLSPQEIVECKSIPDLLGLFPDNN